MRHVVLVIVFLLSATPALADEAGFPYWLQGFKQRAAYEGLSQTFLNRTLAGVEYLPRVIELDRKQPEHKITFTKYKKNVITTQRIEQGQALMRTHAHLLAQVESRFGVPRQYIVALWGIETSYGKVTGGFDVVSSLATLAYEGRRSEFFEKELIGALRILQAGHTGTQTLSGSWAGAMGQCQFMPSSYHKYAVDGDGDGDTDIWNSLPDVFASMANYLRTEGWNPDIRWGRAVSLRHDLPETYYGRDNMRPLSEWRQRGVQLPGGGALPMPSDGSNPKAALVAPDGPGSQTFLVYENYNVIMHWNRSTYFATSVGLLADALAPAR